MVVRELITLLGFKVDRSSVDGVERTTKRVKDQAEQIGSAFRNALIGLASFASVSKLAQVGDEMQSLRARIGQLPQTVGEVGEAFDAVAVRANNAKQSVEGYASFYIKAGQATQDFIKDQESLMRVVDGAAFGLAASGATAAAQDQAFFQLGQAIGSPAVQMEEMNTLIDVAPELFRALGKAIPGANGNLKAFISTGKVSGKMLAEGLMKVLPQFEEKMKSIPITTGQAMTLVNNRFKLGVDRLNRQTLFITKIANGILTAFDMIEGGVTKLVNAFGGLENMLRFVGIALGVAFGAKAIALLNTFTLASLKAALPFALIAAAVASVALVLEDLYTWIQGGDSLIGGLIGPWSEWRAYVMAAVEMVTDAFKWLGNLLGAIGAVLVGLFTLDSALFIEGVRGIASAVWELIATVGKALISGLMSAFEWVVKNLAGLLVSLVSTVFDGVMALATALGKFIGDSLTAVGRGIASILPDFIVSGLSTLAAPVMRVFDALKEIFLAAFTFDVPRFVAGLEALQASLLETLSTWAAFILAPFMDGFKAAATYFSTVAGEISTMLYDSIFAPIVNAVSDAWAAAKSKVTGLGASISGAWDSAKSFVGMGETPASFAPTVSPAQMVSSGMTAPSFNSATTVNLTVPAGSTSEQVSFLQNAAKQSFSRATDDKLARDMSVYGR